MPDATLHPTSIRSLALERAAVDTMRELGPRALEQFALTIAALVKLQPELERLCNPASSAPAGSGVPGAEPPARGLA